MIKKPKHPAYMLARPLVIDGELRPGGTPAHELLRDCPSVNARWCEDAVGCGHLVEVVYSPPAAKKPDAFEVVDSPPATKKPDASADSDAQQ